MSQPDIRIENTIPEHLRAMAAIMREDNAQTVIKLGSSPRRALWKSFKNSVICKTAFINNEVAAIWGLGASCFSDVGYPWLLTAPCTDEYPLRVAFAFRRELNKMLEMCSELEDYVEIKNEKAIRMLELMGFEIGTDVVKRGECNMRIAIKKRGKA